MFKITSVRHAFPENAGFSIDRKKGHEDYTFLHFHNSVNILKNGKMIQTEPHAVILFNKKTPQYFRSDVPLIHDWFHFKGEVCENIFQSFKCDEIFYPTEFQNITRTVAEMETEFFGNRQNAAMMTDIKIKELFIKLDRDISEEKKFFISPSYIKPFRRLREEVFSSLNREWTVSDMANRINISEPHFFMLYKKFFGISPVADLINAKTDSAKNMLAFQNILIDEIAQNLGYNNTTHFIRQFKKQTGQTPSEYRKKNKQF